MRFGFLATKKQQSFESLARRAQERGHTVEHIPLRDLCVSADDVSDFVNECGQRFDALHYYAGVADPLGVFFGKLCEERFIPVLNNRFNVPRHIHDKLFQTLSFVQAGLSVPRTEFTRNPDIDVLAQSLGVPFIAKRARGAHGSHVHKIETTADLSVVDTPASFLFQEYLPHTNDIRVLVLGGKAVCGYKRVPTEGDFRANLARGGRAEALSDEVETATVFALAEAAVAAVPLDLGGVDIIKSATDGRYYLIEINVNPSWYGISHLVDEPFEDALLDVYERLAAQKPLNLR
jgi:ribosomal protein S6--L-glutamate ligase